MRHHHHRRDFISTPGNGKMYYSGTLEFFAVFAAALTYWAFYLLWVLGKVTFLYVRSKASRTPLEGPESNSQGLLHVSGVSV